MTDGRHVTWIADRHVARLPMFDDRGFPRILSLDVRHVQGLDDRHVQGRDAHQVQLALQSPSAALAAASHARACARSDFCRGPRPDHRGSMVALLCREQ